MTVAIRSALVAALVSFACTGDDAGTDASTAGDDVGSGSTGSTTAPPADTSESTAIADDTTSDGSGSSGAPAVDYAGQIQPIWDAACTCHLQGPSGTMQATTLTLNVDVSYGELVSTTATQVDMPRVAPGDVEGSYLWHKLQGTHMEVGGTGTAMPQIGALSAEELELIQAWISSGAPP